MAHLLKSGMILDGRYRIDRMLGEGGFGITYAAENVRIGLKVAIKEFFWHDHSTRNIDESPCVSFLRAEDRESFQAQKDRFLKEARILRDFSSLAGIVHILDYFEENNTAYIVMEYVEGVTLNQYLAGHGGQMEAEAVLRRMLPVIDSLDQIHKSGVIHRDISPDNIMVTPEGELKIIDFGAARQILSDQTPMTAITKACYAPSEQYDKNGRQGPWTDVYALCATLYRCVTGAPPESAIQRMFLDELKAPSQLGIAIAPACEEVIMKGLQLRPEKRWQGMDELAKAVRDALPHPPPPPPPIPRGLIIGLLAGLLCVALALGIWGWRRYGETHKFRGIETERIRFEATEDTTAAEFAAVPEELRKRLEAFVEKDNYILTVNGDSILLTLPLSTFENREIWNVITEHFSKLVPEKGTYIRYEMKANWEDPAHSMIAGQNQVLPDALEGPAVMIRYNWDDSLTRGQRANLIVDFKTRLDTLGVPYAFGSAYGNDDSIMIRIGTDRMGEPVLNILGESYWPFDFTSLPNSSFDEVPDSYSVPLEIIKSDASPSGLLFCEQSDSSRESLKNYTQSMAEIGLDRIYLVDSERKPIAYTVVSAPITDGKLAFQDFCLKGLSSIGPDNGWLLEYYDTVVNKTKLPTKCSLNAVQYVDADGNISLEDVEIDYGITYTGDIDDAQALRNKLQSLEAKYGFTLKENDDFWLFLDLPLDDSLPENIAAKLPAILAVISDGARIFQKDVFIVVSEEQQDDKYIYSRSRFIISTSYEYDKNRFTNTCSMSVWGDVLEPWQESIERWWEEFDPSSYGIEKSKY